NPWGHTFWAGRIYAPYPHFRLLGQPAIYYGLWGSAGFQPMYEPGGGGLLNFLPRAMEWHVVLVTLLALGMVFPWAFLLLGVGLLYTWGYCISCAAKANLDILETTDGPATWSRRLRWRATIAWLHLLEPLARDWGRLKGGLTPWRSFLSGSSSAPRGSPWWQRLQPFRRLARWSCSGNMALEKDPVLDRLTKQLGAQGCACGRNARREAR